MEQNRQAQEISMLASHGIVIAHGVNLTFGAAEDAGLRMRDIVDSDLTSKARRLVAESRS